MITSDVIPTTAQILRAHVEMSDIYNARIVEADGGDKAGVTARASSPKEKYEQASISCDVWVDYVEVKTKVLSEAVKETE